MLITENLKINVWDKEILHWLNISFDLWKNYLILWKNWSWKSSLVNFLMWNPKYNYSSWKITIDWNSMINMSIENKAKAWIFLSFQNIPEIPWINLSEYLRIIYNNKLKEQENFKNSWLKELSPFIFKRHIKKYLTELNIPESFMKRDLNVGFSWWEKRKIELLQAMLLNPKYIMLDEIDSWLDINAFKTVCNLIKKINTKDNSIIIITHNFDITKYINFDKIYILKDWLIEKTWWIELIDELKKSWF
jgi:Fe-S cluster assembly ATP-binding protein